MKLLRTKLVTAMAIAIASGSAMAGWTTNPVIGGGTSIVQDKSLSAASALTDAVYTLAGAEALASGDIIKLQVMNGEWAVPGTGPVPTVATVIPLSAPAGTLNSLGGAIPAMLGGGTAPADTVYYTVNDTLNLNDTITFNTSAAVTDLTSLLEGEDVYYAISFYVGGTGAVKHAVVNITTGLVTTGIDLLTCGTATSSADIINVSDIPGLGVYASFLSTNTASSGNNPLWSIIASNDSGTNTINANIPAGDLVLTATGVNLGGVLPLTYVMLDADLGGTDAALFQGVNFNNASNFDSGSNFPLMADNVAGINASGPLDLNPVVTLKGPNTPAHEITYSAEVLESSWWEAQSLSCVPPAMFTAEHNGSEFSSNSFGQSNKMRITDMSGVLSTDGALVTIEGFKRDGTSVAHTYVPDVLPSNGTIVIQGADLLGSFASHPDRIDFIVESDEIEASNIKTTEGANGSVVKSTTVYRNNTRNSTI